jgi:hypothetical protein
VGLATGLLTGRLLGEDPLGVRSMSEDRGLERSSAGRTERRRRDRDHMIDYDYHDEGEDDSDVRHGPWWRRQRRRRGSE